MSESRGAEPGQSGEKKWRLKQRGSISISIDRTHFRQKEKQKILVLRGKSFMIY